MNGQWPVGSPMYPVAGVGDVIPSSEALEEEAMRRGMPPLDQCLRRCPRCLQGVPIRSMNCQFCQYSIPVSAKAMARREMKEAALQQEHTNGMSVGGGAGVAGYSSTAVYGGGGHFVAPTAALPHSQRNAGVEDGDAGGNSEEEVGLGARRQKRKRQSTTKGTMTATEEDLAELDEGVEDEEPVSWRKSTGKRSGGCRCRREAGATVAARRFSLAGVQLW